MPEIRIAVEVVYALPGEQELFRAEVAAGSTVREAIVSARVLERYPGLDVDRCAAGIFGERVALDGLVRAGDRIEIYRPLMADPKESRRRRAQKRRR